MDIIKELNLNKTPKDVKSGSVICAKNMAIDDTGSFFTNEKGFAVDFECPNSTEFIVGCIPCNTEIVIFTYERANEKSRIYRKKDNGIVEEVNTNWTYNGGKLTGAYAYNYKKELIIALGEYDAQSMAGNELRIPLKTWNLDNVNSSFTYNIEEEVPKFNVSYKINNSGSLVCGVYTFFIRFQVDEASFTKWFQLTDDIIVINNIKKEKPKHTYLYGNAVTNADVSKFAEFDVNDNQLSNKAVSINISFAEDTPYEKFQIGYIIKRNEEILGRVENTYDCNDAVITILTNTYKEEIAIDEFLKEPHQFYNVKNLINYNNRLYISNYSEYENEDLQNVANQASVYMQTKEPSATSSTTEKTYVDVDFSAIYNTFSGHVSKIGFYTEGEQKFVSNPKAFMKQVCNTIAIDGNKLTEVTTIYPNQQQSKYWYMMKQKQYFWLFYKHSSTLADCWYCVYGSDGPVNNYKIRIDEDHFTVISNETGREFPMKTLEDGNIGCGCSSDQVYYNTGQAALDMGATTTVFCWLGESQNFNHMWYGRAVYSVSTGVTTRTESYYNETEVAFNNNRTLIPGQIYNFFVHFIRPDMSVTNGFRINCTGNSTNGKDGFYGYQTDDGKKHFLVPPISYPGALRLLQPTFKVKIPTGYIGYFITYEDVEKTAYPICVLNDGNDDKNVTNTEFEYDGQPISGSKWIHAISGIYQQNDITSKQKHLSRLRQPYLTLHAKIGGDSRRAIIFSPSQALYKKAVKTLYRLTKNIYGTPGNYVNSDSDNAYMFLPGFWNKEKAIFYDKDLIINPTASNAIDGNGAVTSYQVGIDNGYNYADQPLDAYIVKQDYNQGATSLVSSEGKALGVFFNSIISPDRLKDFLTIPACYTEKPSKTYTNYSKNFIDEFNNTIYRSNVISDESLTNGFREFNIDQYRNILENKGSIVNLVGIGLYLIVHTEYSIFVFDRSPKLTNKSQLDIPDTFDIQYQEILPSNEGFGGLSDKEESILSKNGYIWFDKTNKIIFKYENGKIEIISTPINNLLKSINIDTVRFAEDIESNRLLICLYFKEYNAQGKQLSLTISYNFNTQTYISLHDYTFTANYRTYNKSYLFDENKDRKRLYVYDKSSFSYGNLKNDFATIYQQYN